MMPGALFIDTAAQDITTSPLDAAIPDAHSSLTTKEGLDPFI
jgi:hypothetical protein